MKFLTADFGSTYTKLTAIDSSEARIVGTANAFTTIETDIMDGFRAALADLEMKVGKFPYDKLLCCSSAGGGLKMVALGLVPELTSKAAKLAASSAGAKVVKTYAFEISTEEQAEIYNINPDLVLLCGGTDGGNKEVILANARKLCEIQRNFSVIVAGNKSASAELETIFQPSGKDYVITQNVMPVFNKLNIEPAKQCIRELFIKKIIDAKGLSGVQQLSSIEIIPTPLAVMNACELLSKGTSTTPGLNNLLAVDLGGATTDIYSMTDGKPSIDTILMKGLPEPYSKRTVEGDLGMRYSLNSLLDEAGVNVLSQEMGINEEAVEQWIQTCLSNPDIIAYTNNELQIEEGLARKAVELAVERHCGILESTYTPMGEIFSITGKDLTEVPYIIGIGGAIINSINPVKILEGALFNPNKALYMKPKKPKYLIDARYIFASMGLLCRVDSETALRLLKTEIQFAT
ncbi:DNA mismatch repair protein MutL [Solitalea longa]|uniref:DNA mismatch repair protein MutL n=1 Tax=Solitalea longa TaxID=2079460 RepID=A0A2S5A268_9SPHI|nr:methylaspartate mutase accessory protein GlmL [Solitalea longa]POY36624.1 DNA mismatch repair protein MutL [Solitalea longa]